MSQERVLALTVANMFAGSDTTAISYVEAYVPAFHLTDSSLGFAQFSTISSGIQKNLPSSVLSSMNRNGWVFSGRGIR